MKLDASEIQAATTGISVDHEKYGLKVEEFVRTGKTEAPANPKPKPKEKESKSKETSAQQTSTPVVLAKEESEAKEIDQGEESEESIELKVSSGSDSDDEDDVKGDDGPSQMEKSGDQKETAKNEDDEEEDDDDDDGPSLFPDTSVDANVQRTISSTSSLPLQPSLREEVTAEEESTDSN